MGKTWGSIVQATKEYMFASTKKGIAITSAANQDYVLAMPTNANFAFRELCKIKPIVKKYEAAQLSPANLIDDSGVMFKTKRATATDDSYSASNPKAYYFEVAGGYIDVYVEMENGSAWDEILHVSVVGTVGFTAYRGLLTTDGVYRIRFSLNALHPSPYSYRNAAFYAESFEAEADVPDYTPYVEYDLKALLFTGKTEPGLFMRLDVVPVEFELGTIPNGEPYTKPRYRVRGDHVVMISRKYVGQIVFYYQAYPTEITAFTPDTTELELAVDALDAAALYMAAMLLGEDDAYLSARYLEQYENCKTVFMQEEEPKGATEFEDESGWV